MKKEPTKDSDASEHSLVPSDVLRDRSFLEVVSADYLLWSILAHRPALWIALGLVPGLVFHQSLLAFRSIWTLAVSVLAFAWSALVGGHIVAESLQSGTHCDSTAELGSIMARASLQAAAATLGCGVAVLASVYAGEKLGLLKVLHPKATELLPFVVFLGTAALLSLVLDRTVSRARVLNGVTRRPEGGSTSIAHVSRTTQSRICSQVMLEDANATAFLAALHFGFILCVLVTIVPFSRTTSPPVFLWKAAAVSLFYLGPALFLIWQWGRQAGSIRRRLVVSLESDKGKAEDPVSDPAGVR